MKRLAAVIPLSSDLVGFVRPLVAQRESDEKIWPGKWASQKRAGRILKADMKAARQQWIEEADNKAEKERRANADFLLPTTADGKADFHSLRHTFVSRLVRNGVPLKAVQELARHSTSELTLSRYSHATTAELSAAVNSLGGNPPEDAEGTPIHEKSLDAALDAGADATDCKSSPPNEESAPF